MSGPSLLHAQLLDQARHLARKEPRRPLPSSLRRSVSTTYFALHHFLVREAVRSLLGSSKERAALRELCARGFEPRAMVAACRRFARPRLPAPVAQPLATAALPRELRRVAWTYLTLRHHRLRADYDPAAEFGREEVELLLALAEEAMRSWRRARAAPQGRAFALALLLGERIAAG